MMMGWKCHGKVLALPSSYSSRQQVTSINIPSSTFKCKNNIQFSSITTTLGSCSSSITHPFYSSSCTYANYCNSSSTCSLQKEKDYNNSCYNNNDHFAAEKLMMKPSYTNPRSGRNFVDMMCRILASVLSYGVVLTIISMAALYTPYSALAASYGRMGGSSSSRSSSRLSSSSRSSSRLSSSSSSYRSSPSWRPFYSYYHADCSVSSTVKHTCTCDSSCTHCNCNKEQANKEEQVNKSSTRSCSCNCHNTCLFHKKIDHSHGYIVLLLAFLGITSVILKETQDIWEPMLAVNNQQPIDTIETMIMFQVGVSDKERVLQRKLNKIAENADTSTLKGLNYVLKEVVRALLQHDNSSFLFSYIFTKYGSIEIVDKRFQEILNRELDRYDKDEDTLVNVDGVKYKMNDDMVKANSSSIDNEYTVATVLVLATGRYSIPSVTKKGKTYFDSVAVLQILGRIPKNEIQSVEVLWSPQKEDDVMLEEELRRDFPLMVPIENGCIKTKKKIV